MRISKRAEYALRALLAIARERRSWSIQELSGQENIPVKFLEQILLALRQAGVLASKRGAGGGYTLLRAPEEITLGEILCILDGPVALLPCAAEPPTERCTCPDPRTCPLRLTMMKCREVLSAELESRSLEDMLRLAPNPPGLAFEI